MERLAKIYNEYNGKSFRYDELPYEYKQAADVYWKNEWTIDLGLFIYGCIKLPIDTLIELVMEIEDIKNCYDTFQEYHANYMEMTDIPEYTDKYACILQNPDDDEIILDGWHRFHRYYEQGDTEINCMFLIRR